MRTNSKPIVVVGSINTDLVVQLKRLPEEGETVSGETFGIYQGGKGANQAVAASRLGSLVVMVGMVGADDFGRTSLKSLQESGVDCQHVGISDGSSGVAMITVDETGSNSVIVIPGANARVTPQVVESKFDLIRNASIVLTQLELPIDTVLCLAEFCHRNGIPLMLDPAPASVVPVSLFPLCEWITPNESEAQFFASSGTDRQALPHSESRIIAELRGKGARSIALKLGQRGAYLDSISGETASISPYSVDAIDTTAAGDTFNGAFASALSSGRTLVQAGQMAAGAAALSVTKRGAQDSIPTDDELRQFLASRTCPIEAIGR